MEALAAYGSDSDSSEHVEVEEKVTTQGTGSQPNDSRKRARVVASASLPPPVIDSNVDGMINWTHDFLTKKQEEALRGANDTPTSQRLGQVDGNVENSQAGWADQLQRQKEFHNPHFFESVVDHFGIKAMGSNMQSSNMLKCDDSWENINGLLQREETAQARLHQKTI